MNDPTITARGPVGRKLIQALRRARGQPIVDLAAFADGQRRADELQQTTTPLDELTTYDPSHAWYVLAQQRLSILIEQTSALREARVFARSILEAEDEYLPSGPPMSPLTSSYFFYWSVCDLSPGGDGETLARATLDLVREIGTEPNLLAAMDTLERSRMGLWVHQGLDGDHVVLRELLTEAEARCVVPSGYRGRAGEVWLARVLPAGQPGLLPIVVTTPYVLVDTTPAQWLACLDRLLHAYPAARRRAVYAPLMKYGASPRFWPEYVFEGYVNHEPDVIFLTGFPDIAPSRPHSLVNW